MNCYKFIPIVIFLSFLLISVSGCSQIDADNYINVLQGIMPAAPAAAGDLPNQALTPGAIDPSVTQDNINTTICVSGYTKTVRPSSYKTGKMKLVSMKQYGYTDSPSNYEYDHLCPLAAGGCPDCTSNLFPEPYNSTSGYGARVKDKLENALHKKICNGDITLKDAQDCIMQNWIECGRRLKVFA